MASVSGRVGESQSESRLTQVPRRLFSHLAITQPGLLPGGVDALPANPTVSVLARGLAAAHTAYVTQRSAATPVVLFVVQPGERNAFDQRAIEWELSER